MDDATREELRMLRARAYGPASDIDGDPIAQSRLEELERLARPSASTVPVDVHAAVDVPSPVDTPAHTDVSDLAAAPTPVEQQPDATGAERSPADARADERPRLPRRTRGLWIASVVIALLVGAVATVGANGVPALFRHDGVRQVASLRADPGFEWPEFFGVPEEDSIGFEDFFGLTAVRPGRGFTGGMEQECLMIVLTSDVEENAQYPQGASFFGCGTGAFPATAQFPVDGALPAELRDRFPDGSALQFVLDGDRWTVFSDAE